MVVPPDDTTLKHAEKKRKEKHFGAMETNSANSDEVLGGATTLTSSWMEQAPSIQKMMRSTIPWNMSVPHDNTTLAYKLLRRSTSHFVMSWKEVSWISWLPCQ